MIASAGDRMDDSNTPNEDRQRLAMLQAGLDLLDQGLTVFDADLRLVAWNKPFLRLLEFPEEMAYVGAPFDSFIRRNAELGEYGPGDVESQVSERVAAAVRFSPHTTERVRPNGCVLLVRGEPLPDKGFVTLYTDVTQQRRFEKLIQHQNVALEERVLQRTAELERANDENVRIAAALGRSEARLRLINDNMPFLIGYVDRHETYQYANKGYSDWFGVPVEDVMGSQVAAIIGDEVYAQVRDYIHQALRGTQLSYEYQMQRHGALAFARSTLVPEIAADGETLGFFVFSEDITEQKRMQTALIQAQKMESVGQLTGGLAHDFNNLLTVIIGTLVALQEHRPYAAGVDELVEPALQSARRGAQLIRRLLTFSGQQPLEPQSVDIGRLIADMTKLVRRSLPDPIAISTELSATTMHCMVDPGQLESALLNFALNARDAMPDGGRLHVSAGPVDLDAAAAAAFGVAPGAYALIEVADNGCGMDAATLARAYEPFFTTKRFGLGSGLGLAMAYGLVKQSGGGIAIQSQAGQGTTVQLALPLTRPGLAPVQDGPSLLHERELVLLVEDEPNVRRVVRQQLVELGYPVIEAEDGAQALEMLAQIPAIAILLSDVVMPGGVGGRQLGKEAMASHPQIRIVLMSGYSDGVREEWARDVPVLAKPFTRQELARVLLGSDREAP